MRKKKFLFAKRHSLILKRGKLMYFNTGKYFKAPKYNTFNTHVRRKRKKREGKGMKRDDEIMFDSCIADCAEVQI